MSRRWTKNRRSKPTHSHPPAASESLPKRPAARSDHFIPCGVWEAVYILDGLLKNASAIQPDTVHADTQGQSAPLFALAYLLGIALMPRIRDWKRLTFFRPQRSAHYTHVDEAIFSTALTQP